MLTTAQASGKPVGSSGFACGTCPLVLVPGPNDQGPVARTTDPTRIGTAIFFGRYLGTALYDWRSRRPTMKITVTFLGLFLLAVTLSSARQQHPDEECTFNVQGEPTRASVTGPEDLVPLAYVVEQPDSPIEIVSVDLEGMWLSVSHERHTERDCAKYKVRNRSDRAIQAFGVELRVTNMHGGGGGSGAQSSSPLGPGQTVEIQSCGVSGHGDAPENYVRLLVDVSSVNFGDCFCRPSMRIPRSLNVRSIW